MTQWNNTTNGISIDIRIFYVMKLIVIIVNIVAQILNCLTPLENSFPSCKFKIITTNSKYSRIVHTRLESIYRKIHRNRLSSKLS